MEGQFFHVAVQKDRGDIANREFGFDKAVLRDEIFVFDDVLRFAKDCNDEHDAKNAYGNEERIFDHVVKVFDAETDDSPHGHADADGTKRQDCDTQCDNDGRKFKTKGLFLSCVFIFHSSIIARRMGKSNRKIHFFGDIA